MHMILNFEKKRWAKINENEDEITHQQEAEAAAVAKSSCGIHSEYENRVQNREMYRVG